MKIQNCNSKLKIKTEPDVRFLYDMKEVIYDKEWLKSAKNRPLYYMYRGVERKNELRYDITEILPKTLGREFNKTKGNCNSKNYRELYIVLKGKAIFLMQKFQGKVVKDIFAVKAKKGEATIVPPRYYVISINPSKNILKLGNWVSQKNKNIYKDLEKREGAVYYYTKSGWVKNKNYKKIPKLRFKNPLKSLPKNLDFLED
jgi:glucose-6-phosphate isomerase